MKKNLDVTKVEDMIFALTNLNAIENHSIQSYYITKNPKWLELKEISRQMRTKYLFKIVKENEAQLWCISKHILGAMMGLEEVGTRLLSEGKKDEADECFEDSKLLLGLFTHLNEIKGGE